MNLYADPSRPCPEGWTLARTPAEARALLATGTVRRLAIGIDTGPTSRAFRRLVPWMDRTGHWPTECASVHGHIRSAWAIRDVIRRRYARAIAEATIQAALAKSIAHTATGGRLYDQEEAEAFVRERRRKK